MHIVIGVTRCGIAPSSRTTSRSMNRVAVRDDKLILWGMKAIPLNLYLNIPTCNKSITFRGKQVGILVRKNRRKNDFPEMCLPGVEIIPRPRGSILHTTRASQVPYSVKIRFSLKFEMFLIFLLLFRLPIIRLGGYYVIFIFVLNHCYGLLVVGSPSGWLHPLKPLF